MAEGTLESKLDAFWGRFAQAHPQAAKSTYSHYFFCDNEKSARELADLVLAGKKRATTSNFALYEHEGEPLPKAGDYCIITDYSGEPQCIVQTTRVDVVPFKDVSEEFAQIEGEGDGSLAYWRVGHAYFFSRECERMGISFCESMPVVCEQFEVVYKEL